MRLIALVLLGVSTLPAATSLHQVIQWLDEGVKLDTAKAVKLEERLQKKPADASLRVQLLAHYLHQDAAAGRDARTRHILWVLENDPMDWLGLAHLPNDLLRLTCNSQPLADRPGFEKALPLLLASAAKVPGRAPLVAGHIRFCAPDVAERLLLEAGDRSGLAVLYAEAALGVDGLRYGRDEPAGSNEALRLSPLGERARAELASATDAPFVATAAITLLRYGASLWATGQLTFDYSKLGARLLALGQQANPQSPLWATVSDQLPAGGQPPLPVLRLNRGSLELVSQTPPQYPRAARAAGLQGTVLMSVLLGTDGRVAGVTPLSGPAELRASALTAVRQWRYKPKVDAGRPCFVSTLVHINYALGY